jgi:hypothetical protein
MKAAGCRASKSPLDQDRHRVAVGLRARAGTQQVDGQHGIPAVRHVFRIGIRRSVEGRNVPVEAPVRRAMHGHLENPAFDGTLEKGIPCHQMNFCIGKGDRKKYFTSGYLMTTHAPRPYAERLSRPGERPSKMRTAHAWRHAIDSRSIFRLTHFELRFQRGVRKMQWGRARNGGFSWAARSHVGHRSIGVALYV